MIFAEGFAQPCVKINTKILKDEQQNIIKRELSGGAERGLLQLIAPGFSTLALPKFPVAAEHNNDNGAKIRPRFGGSEKVP